jgi:hypothetical protein
VTSGVLGMASCPLPHHCPINQRMTRTESLRSSVISDWRAAQAGTEEFRRATNSRDCKTTPVSLPHGMGFPHPSRKQGEPVQGTSWGLEVRGSWVGGMVVLLRFGCSRVFGMVERLMSVALRPSARSYFFGCCGFLPLLLPYCCLAGSPKPGCLSSWLPFDPDVDQYLPAFPGLEPKARLCPRFSTIYRRLPNKPGMLNILFVPAHLGPITPRLR